MDALKREGFSVEYIRKPVPKKPVGLSTNYGEYIAKGANHG